MQDSGNQGLNRVGQGSGKPRFREPGFGQVLEEQVSGTRAGSYRTKV